ncbi:3-oxoacyl-[acyl-carrier-protein] reductase FabG [Methanosarcinales archaeon]|nr:3-oxoacyl-[acyl-carrier-protein] reductase FabG [Methanosarcinales archaeon]
MTEDQWDKVITIDLKGPFNCIQAVVEAMTNHGTGEIINVSSIVGLYGNIGQSNYSAAKAGLIGLTKTLAKELGRKGIRVNAVAPGFIAYALLYLASDEANFVNGAVLSVDGGLLL